LNCWHLVKKEGDEFGDASHSLEIVRKDFSSFLGSVLGKDRRSFKVTERPRVNFSENWQENWQKIDRKTERKLTGYLKQNFSNYSQSFQLVPFDHLLATALFLKISQLFYLCNSLSLFQAKNQANLSFKMFALLTTIKPTNLNFLSVFNSTFTKSCNRIHNFPTKAKKKTKNPENDKREIEK
jgi:hypothetical protein